MKQNDLLDDEFDSYRGALSDEDLKNLEGKIPYSILRGDVLADICALLDEQGIEYALQPQEATTNGTGIIPLASTQLHMIDTLVYIEAKQKGEADQLVATYEAKIAQEAASAPVEKKASKQFYFWSAVFLVVIFLYTYMQWKVSNHL